MISGQPFLVIVMKPLLLLALAAYVVAAIHSILAFVNKRRALERITIVTLAIGFAAHTAGLAGDWIREGHYPLFGLRETLSFLGWTLVAAFGLIFYWYRTGVLGTFILPLVSLLTFFAILPERSSTGSGPGALLGGAATWLFPFHTTFLLFAYAAFFVVFAASVMYLLQERELKEKTFSAIFHRLPSLTTLNKIATVAAGFGFSLLTLGVILGMLWSSERDGRMWQNDPKEVFAAMTWLLYLVLILYRSTASWRGRRAAWLGVAGFGLVLCTFFGARFLGGYHVFG